MDKNIPSQQSGAESNIEQTVSFPDDTSADNFFAICCERLLDVNNWNHLAGEASAIFQLHDNWGKQLDGKAREGDLFRIDLPLSNKEKFEWVQIEQIERKETDAGKMLAMRVRPTSDPTKSSESIEHFFNHDASSSFIIEKKGAEVKAGIYGRNEKPNIKDADGLANAVRNMVIAIGAMIGMSRFQWKKLIDGIIAVP